MALSPLIRCEMSVPAPLLIATEVTIPLHSQDPPLTLAFFSREKLEPCLVLASRLADSPHV